jgi:hypothetical protein
MLDMYRSMGWYAFDTVIRIQILVQSELEKPHSSLPNNNEFVSNHLCDAVQNGSPNTNLGVITP